MEIIISETAGVRYLHFSSGWIQGAMRIARPWALELDYTREMMAALLLRPEPGWPRRVLLIGLGAASLTKFLYRHRPAARLTVVEIEPSVVTAAYQHFELPEDRKRLRIVIADGADFIARSKARFDLIMVDGYDEKARTGRLKTLPFYANCQAHLSEEGLLVTNLLTRRKDFQSSVNRLHTGFGGRALDFPPCDTGNTIAVAAAGSLIDIDMIALAREASKLRKETGVNLLPMVARLVSSPACAGGRLML